MEGERVEFQTLESAFNKRIHAFSILNKDHTKIEEFLSDAFHIYEREILSSMEKYPTIKSMTIFVAEFEKKIISNEKNTTQTSENIQSNATDNTSVQISENSIGSDKQMDLSDYSQQVTDNVSDNTEERDKNTSVKVTLYFTTPYVIINLNSDLRKHYKRNVSNEIMTSVEETAINGSGFTLSRIIKLDVQISKYNPIRGSTYIKLPKKLELKKAIVNVKNMNDNMCFKWAVLSALHPIEKNADRVQNYWKYENELNFDGIDFPVRLEQIDDFVAQNPSISINVYFYEKEEKNVCPLRLSDKIRKNHIHLLLLTEEKSIGNFEKTLAGKIKFAYNFEPISMHYCWIKNLGRLIGKQLTKHKRKNYICDRCLNFFHDEEVYKRHLNNCLNECRLSLPNEETKWIRFDHVQNQLKAPFVIYADSEAFLRKIDENEQREIFNDKCSTKAYQHHQIYSIGYYFKCAYDPNISFYATSGNTLDSVCWFVKELEFIARFAANKLAENCPMIITPEEELACKDPNALCFICEHPFEENERRARDHCHFTGRFRGISHMHCNLKYKESHTIPVIMHNLSGYDCHLIIKQLATEMDGNISIIPNNSEQYISFTKTVWHSTEGTDVREKIRLKFIDSFRFMPDSLSKLASLLPSIKKVNLYETFRKENYSVAQMTMLERKGVYPYDYVDTIERLSETSLPSKENFYSQLNDEDISNDDYEFACEVWKKFNIKTLGEYSDLYLKTDVLLLADVFENFRDVCMTTYKLDPAHYYTSPGLTFDAMLKLTKVEIELLTDVEMLLFVEKGIRGGITQCSTRYAKANNKYLEDEYNPEEKTNYLMYLDG